MVRLITIILLIFSGSAVWAGSGLAGQYTGTWRGVGVQADGPHWAMTLTLSAQSSSVNYPSVPCGGAWDSLALEGPRALLIEHITHGQDLCIDGSYVTLQEDNLQLIARWYDPNATVYALAILQRDSADLGSDEALLALTRQGVASSMAIDPDSTAMVRRLFGF